jgi:uncharacterized protein YdcH (DUF465 family)
VTENDISRTLAEQNEEYRRLGEEHRHLDQKLMELQSRVYLSPEEELEKKKMQKLKLLKKDQMARLVMEYKQHHRAN